MATKIKYYNCKTAGLGHCWWCDSKTNFILDNGRDEIFCCFACAIQHYKSSKLRRKVRMFERLKKAKNSKNLHLKKEQNASMEGE